MQFENAYFVLSEKLDKELPAYLYYHNAEHTRNVIAAAEKLALAEGITGEELVILKTAALFHDCGFLQIYSDHEEISCEMARKWLPKFGYNKEQTDRICELIMATKIPQEPKSILGKLLCDADLYYLGTDKYFLNSNKLYKELHEAGLVKSRDEWRNEELKFVGDQQYFTQTAKKKLDPTLKQVVIQLKKRLANEKTVPKAFEIAD